VLRNVENLEHTIVEQRRVPLAPIVPEECQRPRGSHLEPHLVSEAAMGISEEVKHRTLAILAALLVVRPGPHHGSVIDADDDHLMDSLRLERLLRGKVTGNLACGSGWRESSGEAHQDRLLSCEARGDVHLFDRRKPGMYEDAFREL